MFESSKECPVCETSHSKKGPFCSRTCSNKSRTNRVSVSCKQCERVFPKPAAWVGRVANHFCSKECHNESLKNRIVKNCAVCSRPFEVRVCEAGKIGTCSREECRSKYGERNPNWRGGIDRCRPERSTKKYKAWRKAVFERDDYTCQKCGVRGGDICADHIKPWAYFPKLRYELSNGRTLCLECHKTTFKEVFLWRARLAA